MCGINGIALSSKSGRQLRREVVERMRDVIQHRGPDDAGMEYQRFVRLSHDVVLFADLELATWPSLVYRDSGYVGQLELRPAGACGLAHLGFQILVLV